MEKDMLPVAVIIAIFVLVAYDIAANDEAWSHDMMGFVGDAWRGLRR
jgi:hypothetical protein